MSPATRTQRDATLDDLARVEGKAELVAYVAMLTGVRDNVQRLVAQKKTAAQVLAAKPSAAWDEKWGKGFMKPDDFVSTVYESLTAK